MELRKRNRNWADGKWSEDEHNRFLQGIKEYGRDWMEVTKWVGTRTVEQIRSHAQKFFKKEGIGMDVIDQFRDMINVGKERRRRKWIEMDEDRKEMVNTKKKNLSEKINNKNYRVFGLKKVDQKWRMRIKKFYEEYWEEDKEKSIENSNILNSTSSSQTINHNNLANKIESKFNIKFPHYHLYTNKKTQSFAPLSPSRKMSFEFYELEAENLLDSTVYNYREEYKNKNIS